MAVAFTNTTSTGWTTAGVGSSPGALSVTKPTDAVDGALLVVLGAMTGALDSTFELTNVTGETVALSDSASANITSAVIRRAAATSDTAYSFDHSTAPSAAKTVMALAFTGHNVASPFRDIQVSTGTSTTPLCPDATAATAGDIVLRLIAWHDNGDERTVTHPAGGNTTIGHFTQASTNGKAVAASYLTSSGGTPGTASWTISASVDWVAFTVVIATAAGGTVNTETLTDTITASDSAARFAIRGNVSTDNITLADAVFWWWYRTRVMTDNLIVTEGATETSTVSNVHAIDEITVSDGIVAWLRRTRLAQDTIAITDEAIASTIGYLIFVSVLTSQLTITDQALTTRYFNRLLESEVLTSDQALRALLVTRSLLDTIDVDDQGLTALQRFILLTDAISLDDSLASVVVTPTVPGVTNPRILIGFDQPRIELGGYGF